MDVVGRLAAARPGEANYSRAAVSGLDAHLGLCMRSQDGNESIKLLELLIVAKCNGAHGHDVLCLCEVLEVDGRSRYF